MDLSLLLAVVLISLVGSALGTLTGIAPGLHINTLALVMVASHPLIGPWLEALLRLLGGPPEAAPLLMAAIIVAAAVAHSFLDLLPSIFLGAPEEHTCLSALPGHRMLLEGKGMEAVASSAYGSLVGATVAVALCLPLALALGPPLGLFPLVDAAAPLMVGGAVVALLWSQRGTKAAAHLIVLRARTAGDVVSIVHLVPVDRVEVVAVGVVRRDRMGRRWLHTLGGRWRLKGAPTSTGAVQIEARWRVRTDHRRERLTAAALLVLSGLLGLTCMEARLPLAGWWEGMGQTSLFPLLTGLFGVPGLLSSLRGTPVPVQKERSGPGAEPWSGMKGALSGALVGWFPGISSTTGVIIASTMSRGSDVHRGPRQYLTMTAAVGTSSTVLGFLALCLAYKGRSGAALAAKDVLGPSGAALLAPPSPWLPLLLVAVLVAAGTSYRLTLLLGRRFAALAAGADLRRINTAVLVLLISLVTAFCGLPGLVVLAVATLLGSVPQRLGVSRVHLTGCMLVPVALGQAGLQAALLAVP